jgi:Tetratricopeptide repeat
MDKNNEELGKQRPRFFQKLKRRAGKKRAPSIDDTVISSESTKSLDLTLTRNMDSVGSLVSMSSRAQTSFSTATSSQGESSIINEPEIPLMESPILDFPVMTSRTPEYFESDGRCLKFQEFFQPISIIGKDIGEEDPVYQDIKLRSRLQALRAQQKLYGEGHPDVLFSMHGLGSVHYKRGEYRQAQRVFDEARRQSSHVTDPGLPREINLQYPIDNLTLSS